MRHSLRNRILISVPAIFIVVMLMVTIAIVVVQSKHSRKGAEGLLRNAFSTVRYTISEKEKDLLDDFGQMILLNDMGGMVKYVTDNRPYFKYSIMRPTYIKIADLIYNTGVIADAFKVGIYDMNGNLIAFSVNGENESTSGYIHNLENIEVAKLKPLEELTYESWRTLDSLPAGVSYNWGKTVPDREITNFEVIDNVLCLAAYIPVMGKGYNSATEKMESRQVGLVVAIQKFDAAFVGKMSELSGTDMHIFSAGEVSVSDCNMHTTFDIGRFVDLAGNWTLTDEPVVFDDVDIDGGSYVRAALPVYSGSKCIAAIVVLYSKENARAGAVQIVKLLSIIYFIGIALIVPATVLVVVRGIINPIKSIASMMRQITYKRDFTQVLKTERRDEIGDLAASFNEMTENLRQTTTSIENLNREIEERQKAESELEEVNTELKNFVYIASHDLREPLRKISAFGAMLQKSLKGTLNEDNAENLFFMVEGAARMTKMIEGLLAYSRVSSKANSAETVNLNDILDQLRQLELSVLLEEKHTTIDVPQPLPEVDADPVQIRQLMQNLIANGMKYQAKDNVPRITLTSQPAANGMVRINITDNGIGIKPEFQQAIFVMFKRLHSKNEYEGTGIGLAVCKKIVERNGGKIGVESEQGKGSTFWFTVPLAGKSAGIGEEAAIAVRSV
ncbi:MAG: hypothetical protein A2Y13_01570 [Planctomycetes bacterium GWC2_45_44]|nr:MAG: hypothetical protein A2Y13_01570 [Planctomycetes bacterium GWC2_45_44]HBR19625.1 hypothetical protein [Phycisphaerales bacterium]